MEVIAEKAHEEWMKGKFANGWTYAPVRDDKKKTNPCLVEWDKLPEKEKEKDRDIARNIIPLMRSVGLRVYRTI
jgi:hypothetical protein